ncbi:MAG: hypothetical protein A2Y93_03075 [Chloroflexi bacterium RBG_13_68_17]|nr:MAG: hypothetical protein A2Y93_03075 [Chloroflexi bacterium RBG_13_68_17]
MRRSAASLSIALGLLLGGCRLFGRGIRVEDAWVRPALAGSNSAVYFRLVNHGQSDQLIAVRTEAAPEAAVHRTRMDAQGRLHMQAQEAVDIPQDGEVVFEPGGLHVMLLGVTRDLLLDELISITLVFEKGGEMAIDVPVESR